MIDKYQGDFLAGFFVPDVPSFDNWVAQRRQRFQAGLLSFFDQAIEEHKKMGQFEQVKDLAQRQLKLTPWHENGHRSLMLGLAMLGQRNEALAQFDRCFELLEAELGVEPDDASVALYEQIATGVIAPHSAEKPTLPQPVTPFIGRIAEQAHIIRTLSQPDCRLLTLTGAGGVGKTRLSVAIAEQVQTKLGREVVFLSLVGCHSAEDAKRKMATALQLPFYEQSAVHALLKEQAPFLILDNVEPILVDDPVAMVEWINELVIVSDESRIMATSRQPLRAQSEWVLPLQGLVIPSSAENLLPSRWQQYDALVLFEQRARQARTTFRLTSSNLEDVVAVCRKLVGTPLTIELAAAQMRQNSVTQLLAQLNGDGAISAELRDLPPRHRSTAIVFADSLSMLTPKQQTVLANCLVFNGWFSRADARNILGDGAALLATFVDFNLLQRLETPQAGTRVAYRLPPLFASWLATVLSPTVDARQQYETQGQTHPIPPEMVEQAPSQPQPVELVGRADELAQLRAAFKPLRRGKNAGLLVLSGAAGIGKSYLTAQLKAESVGISWFDCQSDELSAQGLLPFRRWLADYFRQQSTASHDENLQAFDMRFDDVVAATPDGELATELDGLFSLLAAMVDLRLPDTLYARLQPEQRKEKMQQAVKVLIKAESLLQPVIIVIEDGHWLDGESAELVKKLLVDTTNHPFGIVVTTRPNGYVGPTTLSTAHQTIRLEPFREDIIASFVTTFLGQMPQATLVDWLFERTNGNPFFLQQLLHYLSEHGLVKNGQLQHRAVALSDTSMPLDLQNVLTARIGRLNDKELDIVAKAAVLGREFSVTHLEAMVDDGTDLNEVLNSADTSTIWHPISHDRFAFKHILLQETAYDIQFDAERKDRHRLAATAVGRLATEDQPQFATIAHHLDRAADVNRAADYYLKAGDEARENYFNREAHNHYSPGLEIAESDEQRLLFYLGREQVNHWLGNRLEQKEDLRQLVGLVADSADKRLLVDINLRRATFALVTGDYDRAVRLAQKVAQTAVAKYDPILEARAMHSWARALWQQGKPQSGERILRRALRLTQRSETIGLLALCHYDLAILAYYRDEYDPARQQLAQAIPLFEQQQDKHNVARCIDLLGVIAYSEGNYEAALLHYQQAISISKQIDWLYGEANFTGHIASCYYDLGLYDLSKTHYENTRELSRLLNDREFEVQALDGLGLIFLADGDRQAAKQQFEQAAALAAEINHNELKVYALTHLGSALTDLEAVEEAGVLLYEAMALHGETRANRSEINTMIALAWLDMARGSAEFASEGAIEVLDRLNDGGVDGVEQPLLVYWQCFTIFQAAGLSEQAKGALASGYQLLQEKAQLIADDELRESFLTKVPWHRQLGQRWRSINSPD